jgi:general secretion pathway protein C
MKISPRHLIWVNLFLLALVAYWSASAVSTAIAAKLTPPPAVAVKPPPAPIALPPRRPQTYYATIESRDIFNSTKPLAAQPPPEPVMTKCTVKLWGVVVRDGGGSSCVIEDLTTHKQDVVHLGEAVPGCGVVKEVTWDKVLLDRNGQDEILELATGQGVPGAPARPVSAAAAQQQPSNPHIQLVGDNQYNVDRSEVDSALDNMNQLFTQIRAVPHFDGGKSTGFRLFAIRQNSVFDQLGLKNGDIIQRINGNEIGDPTKALELFGQLRNEHDIAVELLRNKDPVTLKLSIR